MIEALVDESIEYETIEYDFLTIPMFGERVGIETLEDLREDLEREAFIESFANSPILQYRFPQFVSCSKGFSRGKNRKRSTERIKRPPREIQLVQLTFGRYVSFKDGGGRLDPYIPPGMTEDEFVRAGRRLEDGIREHDLKIQDRSLVKR